MSWYQDHKDTRSVGERVADGTAAFVGSWSFIILLSLVMSLWIAGNVYEIYYFDPFPFIFLNLFMSAMAAYSTPVIMMSQNRAADRDRANAEADYKTNVAAKLEVEQLIERLDAIEVNKLDAILKILKKGKPTQRKE